MDNPAPPPTWKIVTAAILDFMLAFVVIGTIIAKLTGNMDGIGWNLTGTPALALLALIAVYFVIGNRIFGGTVFKHVLRTAKKR